MQKINLLSNSDGVNEKKTAVQKPTRVVAANESPPKVPQTKLPQKPILKATPKQPKQAFRNAKNPAATSFGVNLMTEEMLSGAAQQNKLSALGFIALGCVAFVALGYFGMSVFQQRIVDQIAEKEQRIAAIDTELAPLTAKKQAAAAFQKDINGILVLLDSHLYWTKFFAGLERYTVDTVEFTGMNGDQTGRLTLAARATDFASVARQLIAFTEADDFVKDVSITSATLNGVASGSSVTFSATITLVDDVFFRDSAGGPTFPR